MLRIVKLLLLFLGIALVVVVLVALVSIPHNLRVRRARRAYRSLPKEIEAQVLHLIQQAGGQRPSVTFLRLDKDQKCDGHEELLDSHVGGVPYGEAGQDWPSDSPPRFLLQVRLDEPSLGPQWQGRLLTVFDVFKNVDLIARSYANSSFQKYFPLPAPAAPLPCVRLSSIRMPIDEKRDMEEEDDAEPNKVPASPARLCELVPTIAEALSPFTKDPAGLLSQILHPNVYNYDLDEWDIAYEGGDPMIIQNPHEPACDECSKSMRILLQFANLMAVARLNKAVCYVYGCDEHPQHCKGFIDFD